MASTHDQAAERLADKLGAEYNRGKGADVITPNQVTETETVNTVGEAGRQLQGYNKPAYVQGADDATTQKALERYKNSSIGVRDPQGNIVKRSSRKRK